MFTPTMTREDPDVGYIGVKNVGTTDLLDGAPCAWAVLDTTPEAYFHEKAGVNRVSAAATKGSVVAGIVGPNPVDGNKIPVGMVGIVQVYGYRANIKKQAEAWTAGSVWLVADGAIDQDVIVDYPVAVGSGDYTVGNNVAILLADTGAGESVCKGYICVGDM